MGEKAVLVMWDYSAFPLWTSGPIRPESDPSVVPISLLLRSAIVEWAQTMEALIAGSDGSDSTRRNEPSLHDLATANKIGAELAQQVRDELDDSWDVEFHDELTGERRTLSRTVHPTHRRHHNR